MPIYAEALQNWPHKAAVQLLPKLDAGKCIQCGKSAAKPLLSYQILWHNYHGEYNTGLPDYWLLDMNCGTERWGLPQLPNSSGY